MKLGTICKTFALFVTAIFLVSTLAVASMSMNVVAKSSSSGSGTLRIGWLQDPDTMNILTTVTVQGRAMMKAMYDTLVIWNTTLQPAPHLATSWTTSTDGLTWTYQLVHNATWSDGTALKASDVKFTYDFIKNEQLSAYYDNVAPIASITTNGDYEVSVVYSTPIATVLSDMCSVPIVPEHIWSSMNKTTVATFTNSDPVGSGPFKLVSWEKGVSIVLDSNPSYFAGAPKIQRAVFQIYANAETMVNALRNAEIDMIPRELTPTAIALLNADPNIKVSTNPDLYYREISLNMYAEGHQNPTLRDVNVTRALHMAVDKQTLVDQVQLGYADPGSSHVQKASLFWWNPNLTNWSFNISKANKLLNDSGYLDIDSDGIRESPNGTVEMSYLMLVQKRWAEEMRSAQLIQGWWAQIGVKLAIQSADSNTINSYIYPDYSQDMFLWGYSGQPDPGFNLMTMLSTQIQNWNDCGYANATYDQLYIDQGKEMNVETRKQMAFTMQEMVYDQSPYIVLYYMQAMAAHRIDKFGGFVSMATGLLSDLNPFTLRYVHLLVEPTEKAKTDYVPWAVAGVGIVVAIGAIAYAMTRKKSPKAPEEPKEPKT